MTMFSRLDGASMLGLGYSSGS